MRQKASTEEYHEARLNANDHEVLIFIVGEGWIME